MIGVAYLETALLLGVYVLLAGGYGLLYSVARIRADTRIERAARMVYGLHALASVSVVVWTPLLAGWKVLIVATSVAFLAIPPITWRYLQRSHIAERSDDPKPSQHPSRAVARL
jgi:hypothetical protein